MIGISLVQYRGVILYATVTGHLPFGRHSKELTERNIRNVVKYPDYTQSSKQNNPIGGRGGGD